MYQHTHKYTSMNIERVALMQHAHKHDKSFDFILRVVCRYVVVPVSVGCGRNLTTTIDCIPLAEEALQQAINCIGMRQDKKHCV